MSSTTKPSESPQATVSSSALPKIPKSPERVANRQVLESAHEGGGGQFWLTGQFDGFQARNEFGVEAVHLHSRQRGTEAEVHPVSERDVLIGIAADVEAERLVEDLLVAIPGNVSQINGFTFGDRHTADGGVLGSGAHELLDRRRPPDHLLDGRRHQIHVLAQTV